MGVGAVGLHYPDAVKGAPWFAVKHGARTVGSRIDYFRSVRRDAGIHVMIGIGHRIELPDDLAIL